MEQKKIFIKTSIKLLFIWLFFYLLLFNILSKNSLATSAENDNSLHQRAEMLWLEGEDLYEKGLIKEAFEKFKKSFQLEPDPDKGSHLAWLISELEEENERKQTDHICVVARIGEKDKTFQLVDGWQVEVTDDQGLNFFRRSFPYFPNIQVLPDVVACNNSKCRNKIFSLYCNQFSKNFFLKNKKIEKVSSVTVFSTELVNKKSKHNDIYNVFYMVPDHTHLYALVFATQKKAISNSTRRMLQNIIEALSGKNDSCINATINKAPKEIIMLKRQVNELFQKPSQ